MSALTSLLVRDDIVSVRQIEDALQRQVLEGGELDTALLELLEIPENVLIAYRAASFRAMPAPRDDVMSASTATQSLLLAELADAFQITPLSHDATTLVVATSTPLNEVQTAELSAKVGLRVDWRVATELRIGAALEDFYGIAQPPRMRELSRRVADRDAGDLPVVEPLQITPAAALSPDLLEGFDESEDFEAALEAAFDRVSAAPAGGSGPAPNRKSSTQVVPVPHERLGLGKERAAQQAKRVPLPTASTAAGGNAGARTVNAAAVGVKAGARVASRRKRARPPPRMSRAGVPAGPLTEGFAAQVLDQADERDTVIEVFFRYARQYFDTTVLFAVRDDRALGMEAYNLVSLDDVREVSVPLVRGSALEDLVRSLLPRVTDLSRKEEDSVFAQALDRLDAQPSALIPVCIKRRVVSFVYGDRNGEPFQLDDLSPLVGLLPHVSRAFERIIRTRKALAVHTHRSMRNVREGDLGHAPTQRYLASSLTAPDAAGSFAEVDRGGLALAEARTRQALTSLGVPRTAPPPPAPREALRSTAADSRRAPQIAEAAEAEQRLDDEAALVEPPRPSKPPTPFFSKPPPGAGRYSSQAEGEGTPDVRTEPGEMLQSDRFEGEPPEETKPLRRGRSSPAPGSVRPRPSSAPVESPTPRAMTRPPPGASKPPPGTGSYRSQGSMTELIGLPRQSEPPRAQSQPPAAAPRSPQPPPLKAATPREPTIVVDQRMEAEALLAELNRMRPDADDQLVQNFVRLGDTALDMLLATFPGALWFDRRRPHVRVPLGRDISPIARALATFGDKAFARFAGLLRAQSVEVRYYATLFVSDRVFPGLLEPLIERLFDDDPQIRLLVRDILPHYRRVVGFSRVAERLRSQAGDTSAPLKGRLAALDAITVLRDAMSVPILIELLTHSDKQLSVPAHRAIVAITCQDFAKAVKKWRSWYQDNAGRHRVEWLIEALMQSDQGLRGAAGLELQKMTQVYYGYVATAPKREREQAQKRYWDWWHSEGRSKF